MFNWVLNNLLQILAVLYLPEKYKVNPLTPGVHRKVTAAGLFEYVWPDVKGLQ